MSNYVIETVFSSKDTLPTGNEGKKIKGTEISAEFNAIKIAIESKADTTSPTFTGTPTAPTATAGNNTTQLATTAFVTSSQGTMAAQNKTAVDITGGTIVGITDLLPADGGTGVSTITPNAVVIGNGIGAITSARPDTNGNVLTSKAGATISAGSFVAGTQYTIVTPGTTSFTSLGAANNDVGTIFVATGVGSGNGTATVNIWESQEIPITTYPLTLGTVNAGGTNPFPSTSGPTSVDAVDIPSWVKRITVMFNGVSTSSTSYKQIQLGTSSSIETTGYLGSFTYVTGSASTAIINTGFGIRGNGATDIINGTITISKLVDNTWVASGVLSNSSAAETWLTSGSKVLSGALTQVRLTTVNGTDLFDAGSVNVMLE